MTPDLVEPAVSPPSGREAESRANRTIVVISYYDRRPALNLFELLSSIHRNAAGAVFDVCVVVNRTGRGDLALPEPYTGIPVKYRRNVGMNIGAWDVGWRAHPGYRYYLFLQDECYVVREGWLAAFISVAERPEIGMVGESINRQWDRPWPEIEQLLRGESSRSGGEGRLARYRKYWRDVNIDPGQSGRHLRSVVWFAARGVLERVGGFPIGRDYDECVAAEIGVSRKVESMGLRVVQVSDEEFSFIRHLEYNQDFPGAPYTHDARYVPYAAVRRLVDHEYSRWGVEPHPGDDHGLTPAQLLDSAWQITGDRWTPASQTILGRWRAQVAAGLRGAARRFPATGAGQALRTRAGMWRPARMIFRGIVRAVGGWTDEYPLEVWRPDGSRVRLEAVPSCPWCGATRRSAWRTGQDINFRTVEGEFPYVRCRGCGFVYLAVRPLEPELLKVYPTDYPPYARMSWLAGVFVSPIGRRLERFERYRVRMWRRWLRGCLGRVQPDRLPGELEAFYRPPHSGAVLLDFGCGSPWFLNKVREAGWTTIGLDTAKDVVEEVQRHGHRAALTSQGWDEIEDMSVDAVRINHVLEHLYDPRDTLTRLCSKLRSGGGLHLATPNPAGLSAVLFRSFWYSLEAPRHLMLYSPRLLAKWLEQLGFTDVRVIHELTTKDFVRSLGQVLYRCGRLAHEDIARMAGDVLLGEWAELAVVMGAWMGRPDRYHVFARKP